MSVKDTLSISYVALRHGVLPLLEPTLRRFGLRARCDESGTLRVYTGNRSAYGRHERGALLGCVIEDELKILDPFGRSRSQQPARFLIVPERGLRMRLVASIPLADPKLFEKAAGFIQPVLDEELWRRGAKRLAVQLAGRDYGVRAGHRLVGWSMGKGRSLRLARFKRRPPYEATLQRRVLDGVRLSHSYENVPGGVVTIDDPRASSTLAALLGRPS